MCLIKRENAEPHPDCAHPWIQTHGDIGGPATATCRTCGGHTTGPAAQGAVEAFGVDIADYKIPSGDERYIGITNGPFDFRRRS